MNDNDRADDLNGTRDDSGLRDWSAQLGVTPAELLAVIYAVGPTAQAVRAHFGH